MSRSVTLIRSYGLLALGAFGMLLGAFLLTRPTPASFGWSAYAPLSDTAFVPSGFITGTFVLGALLLALGIALAAGWIGFALGRRQRG
ncbi:MAG: hypothetical protein M3N46_05610 [Actinomycetota bacterium]|nr:hypothetical protein [Actinomycetota bacterium]